MKIRKLMKKYNEIENSISHKNYNGAEKILSDCIKISNKIENEKIFNLFKIYVFFLKQDYKNVIDLYQKVIQIINNSKVDNIDTNKYYLGFIYVLVYISSIIIDDIKTKDIVLNELSLLEIDYNNVRDFETKKVFPLYDNNKLLEYLKTHPLPKKLDEAKLEYLMVNLA